VGPQSAGADPGPACYGRGGELPTVTDANLVLGRLDAGTPLAGGLRLDADAAARAVAAVAAGFAGLCQAAAGIVAVANQEMVRAIRVVSVEQGHDPRGMELVAFGGAGPLHACEVADELGIRTVVVPAAGGVLSAVGIATCERRRDAVQGVVRPLAELRAKELRALVPSLPRERGGRIEASADLRYRGQGFELNVALEPLRSVAERFHERHEQRFGFSDPDGEIELINLRSASTSPGPELSLAAARRMPPVAGPARVDLDGATLWVADGWTARARRDGTWRVTR
jgi:N-methylhydantoinase A/oxoprolinase/acetone carboxylase beta subunit